VVLVTGAAGIGKTRFCREVAARARRGRYAVAWGSCWPVGGAPPLWPWQEILGGPGEWAAATLAADGGGYGVVDPERFARFAAIAERVDAMCVRSPMLIVIDDIDAADTGALLLTRFVARTLARRRLVILLTRRTEPGDAIELSPAWTVENEALLVPLDRLDLAETEDLLRMSGGVIDEDLVRALFRLTGGHPLHLQRLAAAGATAGPTSRDGVRAAIAWAVERLSDDARDLLRHAAILGPTPAVAESAAVSRTTPTGVQRALAEAAAAGLVTVEGRHTFSFTHELVREALLDQLTAADEVEAHARAADLLSGSTAGDTERIARLAHHALLAAPRSAADASRAVEACRIAAQTMIGSFAYEAAADLLAAAAAVHERTGGPDSAAPLLVEWAEAVLRCGRLAEARDLFHRAARAALAERDVVALAAAAVGQGGMWINEHRTRMDHEQVTSLQRRAIAELPATERRLRLRLKVRLAAEEVYQGGPIEPALAALDRARRLGDGQVLAEALSLVHHALLTPRHTHSRLELADELIAVASRAGEGMLALLGLCWRTVDLFHVGDSRAETALAELRQRADAVGCLSLRHIAEAMETMLLIRAGQLQRAEAQAHACFEIGTEVGDADAPAYLGVHLTTIRWLQGRDTEMLATVEQIAGSPTLNPNEFAFQATVANLAARTGQTERARSILDRLTAPGLANLPESSTWLAGMLAITEAARALGDADLAGQVYQLLIPYADLPIMPSLAVTCFGSVERVLGVAALTVGDPVRAVEHLQRAVAANRRLGNRPVTAVTNAELAEALAERKRAGDRENARTVLAEACGEAEAMGLTARAGAWNRQLAQLSRQAATIRRGHRHWQLTVAERETVVADRLGVHYLARLLTNPGRSISALQLASESADPAPETTRQPLLDEHARSAYRRRVQQLTDELAAADVRGDQGRSQRLQTELDELLAELRRVSDKGGRSRPFVDPGERARTAVRKAIKRAIDEIGASDPDLGAHLRATVTTGNMCCFTPDPDQPLHWTFVDAIPPEPT
jgi:tetratricopeptide (TPR) repeat protein